MSQSEIALLLSLVANATAVYLIYAFSWSLPKKGLLFVVAVVFNVLLFPSNVRTLVADYLGHDIDVRPCRMLGTCLATQLSRPLSGAGPISSGGIASTHLVQLCRMGLNSGHDGWSSGFEFRDFVAEAKRREKSIDDCRGVLGLRPLADEDAERRRIEEERRLRSLDQARLCNEAVDEDDGEWDLSDAARGAVREAQARRLTRDACLVALGWSVPGAEANPPTQFRSPSPPAPEFPTGHIRNANAGFANLRESPGTNARIVMKLANGTEVVLLGTKPSPASGHDYCRVLTRTGTPGFVDHTLVDGNCDLDYRQTGYLLDIERQEKMEAFQLFRDIAIIGLGLALKR